MAGLLTVLCWLWRQPDRGVEYTAAHVNIWADMVSRHLSLPHQLACVTDMPAGIDPRVEIIPPPRDFEDIRIPSWGIGKPQCLRRLAMFRPDAAEIFGPRFVSMDIDVVIGDSLDPLFDVPDDFKIYAGSPHAKRGYAGGMWLMNAGARPQVFQRFTPELAAEAGRRFIGCDQAWISYVLGPGEATWGPDDGVIWWGPPAVKCSGCRIMFFHGFPKPPELVAAGHDAWIAEHYRSNAGRGRCLMLGHAGTVWEEALAAFSQYGRFQGVIVSPEAAEHWRWPVLAVTADEDKADRIARMYGYEPVWCGRQGQEAIAA